MLMCLCMYCHMPLVQCLMVWKIWDGVYITPGRDERGVGLYLSGGWCLYKVTGTSFLGYRGLDQTLDFCGKKPVRGQLCIRTLGDSPPNVATL